MPKNSKEKRSENVGSKTFLQYFLYVKEDGLIFILERKKKGVELKIVKTRMKVVQRVVEVCQFIQKFKVLSFSKSRYELIVKITYSREQYLSILFEDRFPTKP